VPGDAWELDFHQRYSLLHCNHSKGKNIQRDCFYALHLDAAVGRERDRLPPPIPLVLITLSRIVLQSFRLHRLEFCFDLYSWLRYFF